MSGEQPPEGLCDYCDLMWRGWGGPGCCEPCDMYAPAGLIECTCPAIEALETS